METTDDEGGAVVNRPAASVAGDEALPRRRQTVLDSGDHRALAEFYRILTDAQYCTGSEPGQPSEPRFIELGGDGAGAGLVFQVSQGFVAPDWPQHRRAHTQAHLDFRVGPGELDRAVARAVSLGARVLSTAERADGMVVLADPAGHPFCLLDSE